MSDVGKAEILKEIKSAEEKVRSMNKEAEERRKQLQAEGKRLAIQKIDSSESALRKELDAKTVQARSAIDDRKKVLLEEGGRKAAALTASARKKMPQSKEYVLSEFERAVDA